MITFAGNIRGIAARDHDTVHAWLRANGLQRVRSFVVDGQEIRAEVVSRGGSEAVTVPLTVPVPDELLTAYTADHSLLQVVRDGADPTPCDPAARPTPGQFWHELLEAGPAERLARLAALQEAAAAGEACAQQSLAHDPTAIRITNTALLRELAVRYDITAGASLPPSIQVVAGPTRPG